VFYVHFGELHNYTIRPFSMSCIDNIDLHPHELMAFLSGRASGRLGSMVFTSVNPHRFRFAGTAEPTFLVERNRRSIRNKHMLVKIAIFRDQPSHQLLTDSLSLVIRENQQMRVVNNQMPVRNRIADASQNVARPRRHPCVRIKKCIVQLSWLICRRPRVCAVKSQDLINRQASGIAISDRRTRHALLL